MEPLVLGLIAFSTIHQKQEQIVPEPGEFQPFDVRTLKRVDNARDNSPKGSSDRKPSYAAPAVS